MKEDINSFKVIEVFKESYGFFKPKGFCNRRISDLLLFIEHWLFNTEVNGQNSTHSWVSKTK